jgi:hypothetical protein
MFSVAGFVNCWHRTLSFLPKGDYKIDFHRAASWEIVCDQADQYQQENDSGESDRVGRADTIK